MALTSRRIVAFFLTLISSACGDATGRTEPVTQILIAPDTAYIRQGSTLPLTASVRAASGAERRNVKLTWSSTDTAIATVTRTGLVTAKTYGTTSVTAIADGVTGRSFVVVTGPPGIRALSGTGVRDTVGTSTAQPLVVELRDTRGLPVSGATLTFISSIDTIRTSWSRYLGPQILLSMIGGTGGQSGILTAVTDPAGRAAVHLRFNTTAGAAHVAVSSVTLGYADTARYTIEPGAATRILSTPRDTALFAGRSFVQQSQVVDQHGNSRSDTITYRVASGPVSFSAANRTVTAGASVGRGIIVAQARHLSDTSYVSVVPQGTIAAVAGQYGQTAIVRLDLDGSGYRMIDYLGYAPYYGVWPSWSLRGELVYEKGGYSQERLFVADSLGNVRRATADGVGQGEGFGSFLSDGSIVFSAHTNTEGHYGTSIMRVRTIGGVPTRIGPEPHGNANNWHGAASPDGTRIAYVSVDRGLSIMDIQTGATTSIYPRGSVPRWSPAGDWLVYTEGETLYLIRPDGSNRRALAPRTQFQRGASWSPDGKYLVATSTQGILNVIDVTTEMLLPITLRMPISAPAWRH